LFLIKILFYFISGENKIDLLFYLLLYLLLINLRYQLLYFVHTFWTKIFRYFFIPSWKIVQFMLIFSFRHNWGLSKLYVIHWDNLWHFCFFHLWTVYAFYIWITEIIEVKNYYKFFILIFLAFLFEFPLYKSAY